MAQELGKLEKPTVESFGARRKLLFVPLVLSAPQPEPELLEKVLKYWDEVDAQIANLESKLGPVKQVYHELIPAGGEEGCKAIEELSSSTYQIVQARLDKGAAIQGIEDVDSLTEFMDWSRCLAVGLQNQKVIARVLESYSEARARRNQTIARKIDETLKEGDVGILLMREGHEVQFPPDIEVFYVAPPRLDEIKRWVREREEQLQAQFDKESRRQSEGDGQPDNSLHSPG